MPSDRSRWHVRLVIAWYDVWIGAYWSRETRTLYLMVPFVGIAVEVPDE